MGGKRWEYSVITYEKFPNSFESNHIIGIHLTDIAFKQVNDEIWRVWEERIHWLFPCCVRTLRFRDDISIQKPSIEGDGRDTKRAARKYIPPPTQNTHARPQILHNEQLSWHITRQRLQDNDDH